MKLKPGDDVASKLRQAGVPVLHSQKGDFDGDEIDDWLVVVDTPASERSVESWIFVHTDQEFSAIPIYDYETRFPGHPIGGSNNPIRVDKFPLPGIHQAAIVLQTGEQVAIFVVHHKDLTAEVEVLVKITQVQTFDVDFQANEVKITHLPGGNINSYDIYKWQDGLGKFLKINEVDRLLFEQEDLDEAIRIIQDELVNLNPEGYGYSANASRLYYLLVSGI